MRPLFEVAKREVADARWAIPLALYRLSGRRLAQSDQLYRAGIARQRLARLPGMTTPSERAYYKWHAQERFAGRGEAVDLGSWFGSTTAALAMGLAQNRSPAARGVKLHAYDRFVWEWWMDRYADDARFGPYAPGDSFLAEFESVVAPWRDRIELHAGDLFEKRWRGNRIELLLIDAMKSWELTAHIVRHFYPSLLAQDGYVLHQDFGHCYTPWIHLVSYRLRDYLVPAQDVVRSDTVVFRTVSSPADVISSLELSRESFDDHEVESAFAHSLRITAPAKHSGIRAARLLLLAHDGDLEQAERRLEIAVSRDKLDEFDASAVRGTIEEAKGAQVSR